MINLEPSSTQTPSALLFWWTSFNRKLRYNSQRAYSKPNWFMKCFIGKWKVKSRTFCSQIKQTFDPSELLPGSSLTFCISCLHRRSYCTHEMSRMFDRTILHQSSSFFKSCVIRSPLGCLACWRDYDVAHLQILAVRLVSKMLLWLIGGCANAGNFEIVDLVRPSSGDGVWRVV